MPLPLASMLKEEGFLVVHAHDGVQAPCGIHNRRLDAVITDYSLPDITALDLLRLFECSDQGNRALYEIGQVPCGNLLAKALRLPILPGQFTFSMRVYV